MPMNARPRQSPQWERVISYPVGTHPASKALREKFASAILTGNSSELNQILCEVAKISEAFLHWPASNSNLHAATTSARCSFLRTSMA